MPASILVVDDSIDVTLSVARILRRLHVVTVEHHAHAALARIRRGERFDLILCDIMMPEMTGVELFEALVVAFPAMAERMLLMTGGGYDEGVADVLASGRVSWFEKPFGAQDLRERVRLFLERLCSAA